MHQRLLDAYDRQLRTDSESAHALDTVIRGPSRLSLFPGGRGFISYADLGGADAQRIGELVDSAVEHFRALPGTTSVEWKTRGHDHAPGLHQALIARGFIAEDPESIMIGEAALLAHDVPLPEGVEIRRTRTDADVWAMEEMQGTVFEDREWRSRAETTLRRIREDDTVELWIAVDNGQVVSAGRLEPVAGTDFAGLWVARRCRNGADAASTGRSPPSGRGQPSRWGSGSCSPIRPSSPGRSWSAPGWSRSRRRRPTCGRNQATRRLNLDRDAAGSGGGTARTLRRSARSGRRRRPPGR